MERPNSQRHAQLRQLWPVELEGMREGFGVGTLMSTLSTSLCRRFSINIVCWPRSTKNWSNASFYSFQAKLLDEIHIFLQFASFMIKKFVLLVHWKCNLNVALFFSHVSCFSMKTCFLFKGMYSGANFAVFNEFPDSKKQIPWKYVQITSECYVLAALIHCVNAIGKYKPLIKAISQIIK